MNNPPPPCERSNENSRAPLPSTDPGASITSVSKPTPATLKQWQDSQSHHPIQRVPRMVVAHIFKDSIKGPPSWIIEPKRKYVKPVYPWLSQPLTPTDGQNKTEAS